MKGANIPATPSNKVVTPYPRFRISVGSISVMYISSDATVTTTKHLAINHNHFDVCSSSEKSSDMDKWILYRNIT